MRLSAALRALVADPRSVRALDETCLDIETELAAAQSWGAQTVVVVRSLASLVRVVTRVGVFEVRALAPAGWAIRLTLWTKFISVPLVARPFLQHSARGLPALLLLALIPQALCVILPLSTFFTSLWPPKRSASPVALQMALATSLALLAIVATPPANPSFRLGAYSALNGGPPAEYALRPGLPETSLPSLARQGFRFPSSDWDTAPARARRQFFVLTGLIASAAGLAALGALMSVRIYRRWPAAAVPVVSVGLYAITTNGLGFWLAALIAVASAVWLAKDLEATSV